MIEVANMMIKTAVKTVIDIKAEKGNKERRLEY